MLGEIMYKRTSSGAIQTWLQEANDECIAYRSVSGQFGGKIVYSSWKFVEQKNVGRANETSLQEQVELEVISNYKDKMHGGYVRSKNDVDNKEQLPFKPMLAQKYEKYPIKDWDNVYSQPKLDGIRANVNEEIRSRSDKPLPSCPHIPEDLAQIVAEIGDIKFDGELYNHGLKHDFNKIISLARKSKPSQEEIDESAEKIQYWVYDIVIDAPFSERTEYLKRLSANFPESVVFVETTKVRDQDHLDQLYSEYMIDGFEGQMVRIDGVTYEHKRSKSLLKRKEFMDKEFKVLEICEGKGNREGMAGYIRYEIILEDGTVDEFSSGIKGTHAYATQLLKDKEMYVGCPGTVQFFEYTEYGKPRFPVTLVLYPNGRDT